MRLLAFAAFLLLVSSVYPAFVYGDIYSSNLEKINKTLVKVEGEFSYQVVTDKANYSIFLPEGEYRISASSFNEQGDLVLYTEENIKVGSEDQKVDLVLSHVSTFDQLIIVALVFLIIIVFIWSNHFWYPGKKNINPPPNCAIAVGMKLNIADMDKDGDNDIVICGKGGLYVFYNEGLTPSPRTETILPPEETYPTWIQWYK